MKAAIQALGLPVDKFDVKIIQIVNLLEEGQTVRMSKRDGTAVSLRELMDEVGVDAVRYYFVMRSNESQLDLDRKSTRLNSSHVSISYAVFCLKKKIKLR